MKNSNSNYEQALKRVKQLKDLYNHIPVYIILCALYVAFCLGVFDGGSFSQHIPFWSPFCMVGGYGLSLVGYYIYLKHGSILESRFKNWEKRKIKEYLDQEAHSETHSETHTSRWE